MTTGRGPKRILVVEDEENISQTLRYNLTREGYEVSEAATGLRPSSWRGSGTRI
jgi:DNA-binding response OmpR family regulator